MPSAVSFHQFRKVAEQHPASEGHRIVRNAQKEFISRPIAKNLLGRAKPFTDQEKLENRKAWHAFQRCIETTPMDPARRETIFANCERYGIDFDENAKKGAPLYPIDIEKVGVAAGILKTKDLGGSNYLRTLSPSQIHRRIEAADPFHFFGKTPENQWHNGGPTTLKEYLERDPFLAEQRQLRLFSLTSMLYPHPHAFPEHLTKGILSAEPTLGTVIPAPDRKSVDFYQVARRVETREKGGLFALLLTPISGQSNLPTVLGFRPTQMKLGHSGPLASLREDARKEIGKQAYAAAKDELAEAIRAGGENLVGVGYSKGGTELARCFIDNWQHFSEVIFFNDPSMEKELVEEFAQMINSLPRQDRKRSIVVYRTKNDISHFGGEKHVGWGIRHPDFIVKVVEVSHPSFEEDVRMYDLPKLLERHGQRHFLEHDIAANSVLKIWEGRAADSQLDNTRRGERVVSYEAFRLKWGYYMFQFANCMYKLLVKIVTCLGFKVDRESLEHV